MVTRGPIQVIELIAETSPRQIIAADHAAAVFAENVFARDKRDFELAAHFRSRSGQRGKCALSAV